MLHGDISFKNPEHVLIGNPESIHFGKGLGLKYYLMTRSFYLELLINRGSYMSAHVLLNLLNELGERDKMRGLPSILSLFRNEWFIDFIAWPNFTPRCDII